VPRSANFFFYPAHPACGDTVQFIDITYDKRPITVSSRTWRFGDGSTATGPWPIHTYAAGGDYSVELMLTTSAGETVSAAQTVNVRP
jgi:serine protease